MAWLAGVVQAGVGIYQAVKSQQALNELQNKTPDYSVSPELKTAYSRANELAGEGFTPQEKAAYDNRVATSTNTAFRNGIANSGGNLSQALRNGIQAEKIGANNDFASTDAQLHRSNIHYADSLAQEMQNQKNLIDQNKISRNLMLQQAYGGGKQAGISNAMGGAMTSIYSASNTSTDPTLNNGNAGNKSYAYTNSPSNPNNPYTGTPANLNGYNNMSGNWLGSTGY